MVNSPSIENRSAQRRRTLLGAKIVINSGGSVFDCLVKNLSETGALIHIENSLAAPSHFTLQLSDGRHFECQVMWRGATRLGVKFQ